MPVSLSTPDHLSTDSNSKGNHENESHKALPVKVAFLTGYIPPYALPVFQEIAKRVEKLTVLVSTPMEGNRKWDVDHDGVDVRVQKTWTHLSKWKHRVGFTDSKETHIPVDTLSQLRRLSPDVIVSEELGYRSLLSSAYQLFSRKPLLLVCNLSEHTETGRGGARAILRRWLSKRANVTTANGTSGIRYLQSIGFAKDTLHIFPYAARPGVFDTLPVTRSQELAKSLLYVGEISERKGVEPFVRAVSAWLDRNPESSFHLKLIGVGPLTDKIRGLNYNKNLKLEWLGHCDYEEVAHHMAMSGVLVFPTLADEWGLVVNEALSAGLPVMGSVYSQAVSDLVCDGSNGWQFDVKQEESMHRALDKICSVSYQELEAMRMQARESVIERTPSWAADKFITALESACEALS